MIIEAAEAIMTRNGSGGLTARGIAGAIGYAAGTIYNHFANLDEVVLAVNMRTIDALATAIEKPRRQAGEAALHRLADAYIDFTEAHPHLWAALFEDRPGMAPVTDLPWYRTKLERPIALVQAVLARLDASADSEGLRAEVLTLWGGLHGICTLAQEGYVGILTMPPTRIMAHLLVDNAIAGLKARRRKRAK